jgi:prevent-host-death family protein
MEKTKKHIGEIGNSISVAEAKSRFSEYISKVAYANEQVVITKRGKPIAALVSIKDMKKIKFKEESRGLYEIIGKWKRFNEIKDDIDKAFSKRSKDRGRDVSF